MRTNFVDRLTIDLANDRCTIPPVTTDDITQLVANLCVAIEKSTEPKHCNNKELNQNKLILDKISSMLLSSEHNI